MGDARPGWGSPGWYADPWGQAPWRWFDGVNWTGWTWPPPGAPGAPPYARPGTSRPPAAPRAEGVPAPQRRRLVAELLIVLGVFPLPYALGAILVLVEAALGEGSGQRTPVLIAGHAAASFPFEVAEVLLPFIGAALVWYLLSLRGPFGTRWQDGDGEGGLKAIGLDFSSLRGDLAFVIVVFVLCELLPIVGGALLLHAAGVHGISPSTSSGPRYYVSLDFLNSFVSGTVEEIVVLGFLVRRLEQLRLPTWAVVLLAVVVRGSYHLYYGWGVLPILAWAAVTAVLYLRYRRLLPFIITHVIWDASIFATVALGKPGGGIFIVIEAIVLLPASLVLFLLWKEHIPLPIRQGEGASPLPSG